MAECNVCFGNGFIYVDGGSTPCPECWGTGEMDDDGTDIDVDEDEEDEDF